MKRALLILLAVLILAASSCAAEHREASVTLPETASDRTLYGFFNTPSEPTIESVIGNYELMGKHADAVLFQQSIPWADFSDGADGESVIITDMKNHKMLADQNGLDVIIVIDPLNGLNRREFYGLPEGWVPGFGDPQVRAAFTNFTMRVLREFRPAYLGLASEINTYQDSHPDDFLHYLSLYNTVYDMVKAEAPETGVFVTFQWEEMHNLMPELARGEPYDINWDQMEQFEPRLDVWAISSYPFAGGFSGKDIPTDYYTPLLARTSKPVAVAEGGYNSEPVNVFPGTPQDQVDYLNAIHSQIGGERLAFWVYLIIRDLDLDAYAEILKQQGHADDAFALGFFIKIGFYGVNGEPKPALTVWESFRNNE